MRTHSGSSGLQESKTTNAQAKKTRLTWLFLAPAVTSSQLGTSLPPGSPLSSTVAALEDAHWQVDTDHRRCGWF